MYKTRKIVKYIANIRIPSERAHTIQILKMCEAFALNGRHVELTYPRRENETNTNGKTPLEYYQIPPVFKLKQIYNVDVIRFERTLLKRIMPFLFVIQAISWAAYAVLKVKNKKESVIYTRDIYVVFWSTLLKIDTVFEIHSVGNKIQNVLYKKVIHKKSLLQIVCLTSFIKKSLVDLGFAENKISIHPDAVDLQMYKNIPDSKACKIKLGLKTDAKIIGYVGTFSTMGMDKGISILLESFSKVLKKSESKIQLLCVGGPLTDIAKYEKLMVDLSIQRELVSFYDRVSFDMVPYWIKACDILTIPWEWNQHFAYYMSPLKLFEYMATGNPIISSDFPSIREVLTNNINAYLVKPGCTDAISESICTILSDLNGSSRIVAQALSDVEKYTWEKRAKNILSTLVEIAK